MKPRIIIAAIFAGLCLSAAAQAQYPTKPIRLVVPYPPGGPTDFVGRAVAAKLTEYLGQQMVVDNRPGAGTVIASEIIARAAPDGYNLLFGTGGGTFLAPLILPKVPYDPQKDYASVAMLVMSPQVLVVHPALGANSVKELIAVAKAKPGQLNFSSVGTGTSPHLGGELFKSLAGIDLVHVPYKGSPQYVIDLLAARIDLSIGAAGPVLPHAKAGRLRLLGVSAAKRDPAIPDVPAISEAVPGFEVVGWYGLLTTAGTPAPVVRKLHAEAVRILALPDVKSVYANAGMDAVSSGSPAEFDALIRNERDKWAKVIKGAGIRIE